MGKLSQVVAVVDDDAAVRHALKFALEFEGLKVRLHDSAQALLNDPDLQRYGCLVIDYRMPDIDGLELTETLRQHGIRAPIIMITGRANSSVRDRAGRAGIDTILEKPLSDGALSAAIHSALGAP
jgi:two-component system, LuxR family, response regulator FixJ